MKGFALLDKKNHQQESDFSEDKKGKKLDKIIAVKNFMDKAVNNNRQTSDLSVSPVAN